MIYRFGAYELDIDRHELRRAGERSAIEPQVFEVLAYLITERHRVVSKQELLDRLWPEHFVSDNTLHQRLTAARRAIGDNSRLQASIQTMRGLGYRFIAEVETHAEAPLDAAGRQGALLEADDTTPSPAPSLPQSPPLAPKVERRQLTIMCCHLVDATVLARQFDPEDLRDIIQAYHETCTAVAQRYAGHIARYLEDRVLVYFGYPQAHEDDARRAVHAGLGILDAVKALNTHLQQDKETQIAIRVGVHTGLVVVGDMGSMSGQDQLALGEAPTIADRLQAIAKPDTAVVSEATYRLVDGYFDCESLGEQTLSGGAPVALYRILGDKGTPSRLDIATIRGLTPLVGREQEMGLFRERWRQVKEGQGQVVLLSGEAGIGKSRLAHLFKEIVTDASCACLESRCLPYYQNSALYPIIDLFQRLWGLQEEETPDEKLRKMEAALQQYRLPWREAAPLFAILLSIPYTADRYPPLDLSPEQQRRKTLEAILTMVLQLAEQQPVIFILEDAHWTDPTTLELFDLLTAQAPSAALLTLLTCRPEFQTPWGLRPSFTPMALHRLSRPQVEQMVDHMAAGKHLPIEVRRQIVEKTDGVPLFVEEWTKAILASDFLRDQDGHYELTEAIPEMLIPPTLQDSLMARLDHLPTVKDVVYVAATIGREFSYALLEAITPLDAPTLQLELRRLVEAELLYQRGLPPAATYLFKHALIRDAAYESLLKRTRQDYHQKIAAVLEEQFPETAEAQPELLAHHFTQAESWTKAFGYLVQAGDQARQTYANQEATAFYTQAIAISGRMASTPDEAQRLPVYESRGLVRMLQGALDEAITDFHVMRRLARVSSNQRKEGESLGHLAFAHWSKLSEDQMPFMEQYALEAMQLSQHTGDQKVLAKSLTSLGLVHQVRGDLQEGDRHLETSLAISRREDFKDSMAQNLLWLNAHAYWQGHAQRALPLCEEGLAVSRQIHDGLNELFHLAFLCLEHGSLGHYGNAFEALHEGLTKAKERDNLYIVGRLTNTRGWLHSEIGDMSRALEYDHESAELGDAHGITNVEISALINLGYDYLALGQHERARSYFEPILERVEREAFGSHRWRWKIRIFMGLAQLAYLTGAYEQAWRYAELGLQEAERTASQKYVAIGWAWRGKIAAQLGNAAGAGRDLQRAFTLAEQLQSPSLIYPIAYDLGQWCEKTGKEPEAVVMYGKARDCVERMASAIGDETLRAVFLQSALAQTVEACAVRLGGQRRHHPSSNSIN